MIATAEQLYLLHHTLGLSEKRRLPWRNHFVAGAGHHDMPGLLALELAGLMQRGRTPGFCDADDIVFCATEAGKAYAIEHLAPVPTRSRYGDFLDADYGYSFAEWLGIQSPEIQSSNYGAGSCFCSLPDHYRYRRPEFTRGERWSPEIMGEWKPTKKEAKASYKIALAAWRNREKEWSAA